MRVIGLDVSGSVAEVAYLEDGHIRAGGRVDLLSAPLAQFAGSLRNSDHVVLEATGNTPAIVAALQPHVERAVARILGTIRARSGLAGANTP